MEIDRTVTTTIDQDRCIGCGDCIRVCPKDTISLIDEKAVVTGTESLVCDHCQAVCRSGAISVEGIDRGLSHFSQFSINNRWLPHGEFDTASLVNLMLSRRSCRNFKEEPVPREVLEDLIKIGVTAPSGSNCQQWTFTVLKDRRDVLAYGDKIRSFFDRLNRLSEKKIVRTVLKWIGKPELDLYYTNYYSSIKDSLAEWEQNGTDRLFHGSTAVIVVSSRDSASCPSEDALLATQNMLLGAHAMGLGTCLVGFAIKAMDKDHSIRRFIGLPQDEVPYAVIGIGYPDESYKRLTGRKPVTIRYFGE